MSKQSTNWERFREVVSSLPDEEEIRRRGAEGWQLIALEWQRPSTDPVSAETPYGLRAPEGGTRLIEDPREEEALRLMLALVIDDRNTLSRVAEELNRRGLTTRQGGDWNAEAVFNMMPRLVEVAPRLYSRPDWQAEAPTALT